MKNIYKLINIPEADMAFTQKFDDHTDDYITIAHIIYDGHDRIHWYDKPKDKEYDELSEWFYNESEGLLLMYYDEVYVDR